MKKTWNDITLKQLLELEKLEETVFEETDIMVERLSVIYGEDCNDLSIPEFLQRVADCEFLSKPIPDTKVKGKYTINGTEYEVMLNPFEMSMGQYIDFKNTTNKEPEKLYALIFIPKGHKYNDGYDMAKVYEDMMSLPVPEVKALNDFFFRLMVKYHNIFQLCLKHMIRKERKNPELRPMVDRAIQIMESYFTSLHSLE